MIFKVKFSKCLRKKSVNILKRKDLILSDHCRYQFYFLFLDTLLNEMQKIRRIYVLKFIATTTDTFVFQ